MRLDSFRLNRSGAQMTTANKSPLKNPQNANISFPKIRLAFPLLANNITKFC
jgi:hypothetical protein